MGSVNNAPCRAVCDVAACDIEPSRGLPWRLGTAKEAEQFQDGSTLQRGSSEEGEICSMQASFLYNDDTYVTLGMFILKTWGDSMGHMDSALLA
ncbi:hypothetical protein NDU88_002767 [Pleurodeles waltl]|uniref:Uncharacterized protein n=1 Tax=Pleurodeles waltl TaxID=8319 RepID=A0AAV7Q826_PLEWA|nr:hypothetical protein NDU88_002767 [Pleurodeles waltl]